MHIRKMTIKDFDGIYQLWVETPGMGLNALDDSKEGIERYLKRNPDTCFVAEVDKRIVGSILSGHDGRRGFIYHTAVSVSMRKQGIGSALVDASVEALKNKGINKIALVVFSENIEGNVFWEKRGFTVREDLVYRNKALVELEREW